MKKLLYITCNSKPEEASASKTVARYFLEELKAKQGQFEVEELDLYNMKIPELKTCYLDGRCNLVEGDDYSKLPSADQENIKQIKLLAEQFKQADFYLIAAPLWNMKIPGYLSMYFDSININKITLTIQPNEVSGRLDDKERTAVYVQASGGSVTPGEPNSQKNHAGLYVQDLLSFMGIKHYHEVLVENTGYTEEEQHKAVAKGKEDAKELVKKL